MCGSHFRNRYGSAIRNGWLRNVGIFTWCETNPLHILSDPAFPEALYISAHITSTNPDLSFFFHFNKKDFGLYNRSLCLNELCSKIYTFINISTSWNLYHRTISNVPAPIRIHPITDLKVNSSCRKTNASISVMTTDNLSIGTTFEASPICKAL